MKTSLRILNLCPLAKGRIDYLANRIHELHDTCSSNLAVFPVNKVAMVHLDLSIYHIGMRSSCDICDISAGAVCLRNY